MFVVQWSPLAVVVVVAAVVVSVSVVELAVVDVVVDVVVDAVVVQPSSSDLSMQSHFPSQRSFL